MISRARNRALLALLVILSTLAAAPASAQQTSSTGGSRLWVWAVAGGLVLGGFLLFHVASAFIKSLPDEIRDRLRSSAKANIRPLVVASVILAWTLVYALYSMSNIPGPVTTTDDQLADPQSTAAGLDGSVTPGDVSSSPVTGGGSSRASVRGTAASATTTTPEGFRIAPVNLYSGAENVIGLTPTTITLCGHASLIFAKAVNARPEDLDVYWRWINNKGGVHGRTFTVTLEDDRYDAAGAIEASQRCKEKNPFFLFGGVGSDLIPGVRQWAEQNKLLYIYSFAARKGSEGFKYAYTGTTSQEDLSRIIGELAVTKHPDKKHNVGIVWRNSSNIQPGHDSFVAAIQQRGGKIVADIQVAKNQGQYATEANELRTRGAQLVFMLDDAVSQLNFIRQATTPTYRPNWFIFPFNIQIQTMGEDALNPPWAGALLWPAYTFGDYGGTFASYASWIKEFEAAYAQHQPDSDLQGPTGDLLWDVWVSFKQVSRLFEICGRDCTRNRIAGIFEGGYKDQVGAACPVDFSVGSHHYGGGRADIFEAYRGPGGKAAWRTTHRCVSGM